MCALTALTVSAPKRNRSRREALFAAPLWGTASSTRKASAGATCSVSSAATPTDAGVAL
jgi:hypothetical protein